MPHAPTRSAQYKLERAVPHSVGETGLFTLQSSISLLTFLARSAPGGAGGGEPGIDLSGSTDPGPQDLAGYRLERALPGDTYGTLLALSRETSYHDDAGAAGARYRLFAVNGLGEELLVCETAMAPARALAAWPLPYRGGSLNVSFATPRGLSWNGRDDAGGEVPSGLYFLRARTGTSSSTIKLVVGR